METPKARPVDPHAYLGPDVPDSPRSPGHRVRAWIGWTLALALGLAAANWNLTFWAIGVWAVALVAVLVADQIKRHRRRQPS